MLPACKPDQFVKMLIFFSFIEVGVLFFKKFIYDGCNSLVF